MKIQRDLPLNVANFVVRLMLGKHGPTSAKQANFKLFLPNLAPFGQEYFK